MANKKVSQLTSKPSVLVTDLFPIADPSTGQLYKTTISDLGTAIGSGVSSVNGLVGAVVLDTDDIQELVSPTNKWFTDTRARAALSASSPLAYNSGTGVFSIPAATSSQNGYLTSTDWTTFNSKVSGSGDTGYYARWTSAGVLSDGFINTDSNITYVSGVGLTTLSGLDIQGNFGGGSGGLKLKSYDETTGKAYIEFFNTSGNFRLGLEGSTGGGILPGSTAYATVLTTGLTAKNLEFGTNNAKRLTLDGTTGNATFESSVGIGTSSLTGYNLRVSRNITGATTAYGVISDGVIQNDVTASARMFTSNTSTQATTFTLTALSHYVSQQGTFGAGSTVTNQYGFFADSSLIGATNNYGFFGNIAAGTNRWNLYMGGTANNYMAGSLGIGAVSLTGYSLKVSKVIAGAASAYGIVSDGTIQSDVIGAAIYNATYAQTQAASFTLPVIYHYYANQGNFGAGSTVTNQHGFFVSSNLTGATNNYGFRGEIAAGTGRWNLYMSGTANNHLAGNLLLGSTENNGSKLQVTGAATFSSSVLANSFNIAANGTIASNSFWGTTHTKGAGSYSDWSLLSGGSGVMWNPTGTLNMSFGGSVTAQAIYATDATGSAILTTNGGGEGILSVNTANPLRVLINGGEKVRVTSAGNVGIGTTAPTSLFHIASTTTLRSRLYTSSGASFMDIENAGNSFYVGVDDSSGSTFGGSAYARTFYGTGAYPMVFWTNATERMRITSGGDVLVGMTGVTTTGVGTMISQGGAYANLRLFGTGTQTYAQFFSSGTATGSITGTAVLVSYNTTSDYRLKEDLKPINGLEIVNKIKVYDYKWKSEDSRMDGVLAHELAEVLPYAVSGVKDGEQMQGVDYSKIVPVMVQAIKDLKAELDTLKNK